MNDLMRMEILETSKDTSSKKPSFLFGELMLFTNMISKISSWHQIHHQVQIFPILKGLPHVDDELVFDLSEELSLVAN